jgi:hypothetical protein
MPILPVDEMCADLNDYGSRLIRAAFNSRTGAIRATKPFRTIDFDSDCAFFKACANYVWRMLCFDFVPYRPHNCMPVTADWDILTVKSGCADQYKWGRAVAAVLDRLIQKAESVMPISAQRGVMSWRGLV